MTETASSKPRPPIGEPLPEEFRRLGKPGLTLAEIERRLDALPDYGAPEQEKHYREFVLRRDPTYTYWRVFNIQGNPVKGLEGAMTTIALAKRKIDLYLERQEEKRRDNAHSP
jgi:hypothetical protein